MPDGSDTIGSAWVAIRPDTAAFEGLLTRGISGPMQKAEGMFGNLGKVAVGAVVGIGAAAVGTGLGLAKMAGDFQQLMTRVVTGANESQANLKMVSDGILQIAGQVGIMPDELAKGLYNIESAGFHAAGALQIVQAAAQGAKADGADMATVADALTTAMNAYHLPASQAVAVTDQLVKTVALGKTHMQDLAGSLSAIVPIAAALNVPMGEVGGAMATMTAQGTDAGRASQSLRFLMAALAGPTSAAATEFEGLGIGMKAIPGITKATTKALDDLGLNTSAVADTLAKHGLAAALQEITDAIGKKFPVGSAAYEAALKGAVGGTRGLTAALELTGQNMPIFETNIKAVTDAAAHAGKNVDDWATVQSTFNQKMDDAKAAVTAAGISIGTMLLPYVSQAADWMGKHLPAAINTLHGWIDTHKQDIEHWAGVIKDVLVKAFSTLRDVVADVFNNFLKPLGQFALDHKQVFVDLGVAIAGLFVAKKVGSAATGWVGGVLTDLGRVKSFLTGDLAGAVGGVFGGAKGLGGKGGISGALSMVGVQKVFVVNMPGGGIPGLGNLPAAGGAAGAGEAAAGGSVLAFLGVMGATIGAAALGAAAIYGAGIGLTYLTGHQNDIGGPLGGLADPVAKMIGDLNVSSDATSALRGSLQTSSPQFVLALSRMTQSQTFSSLAADRQKLLLEDLASAMQSGLVTTPQDVQNFADSFSQAQQAALGLPPDVKAVNTVFSQNKQRFANDINSIVTSLDTSVGNVTPLPKNLQDLVDAVTPKKPTSLQGALDNVGKALSDPKFTATLNELQNAFSNSVPPAQVTNDRLHDLQTHVTDANQASALLQGHFAAGASNGAAIPQSVTSLHLAVDGTSIQTGVLGSRFTGAISSVGNLPSAAGGLLTNVNTAAGAAWLLAGGLRGALNAVGSIIADVKSSLPHSATGNTFPLGGLSWVGEQGPELAYIPAGGQIIPHGDSLSIASGMRTGTGGGMTVHQTFHINGGDPAQVQAIIHQEFRSLELSLRAQ